MADENKVTGKGRYGTRHLMEEGMREAGQGVFEPKSGASRRRKAAAADDKKDA
jgi:hypothetical protein